MHFAILTILIFNQAIQGISQETDLNNTVADPNINNIDSDISNGNKTTDLNVNHYSFGSNSNSSEVNSSELSSADAAITSIGNGENATSSAETNSPPNLNKQNDTSSAVLITTEADKNESEKTTVNPLHQESSTPEVTTSATKDKEINMDPSSVLAPVQPGIIKPSIPYYPQTGSNADRGTFGFNLFGPASGFFDTAKGAATNAAGMAVNTAVRTVGTARKVAVNAANSARNTADQAINTARGLAGRAADISTGAFDNARNLAGQSIGTVVNSARSAGDLTGSAFGGATNNAKNLAGSLMGAFSLGRRSEDEKDIESSLELRTSSEIRATFF